MDPRQLNRSRRTFIKLGAAAVPLALGLGIGRSFGRTSAATANPRLGVQTYSFRDMLETPGDMADKMIAALHELGLTECEVFEPTLQPPELSAQAAWRTVGGKPTQASLLGRPPTAPPTAAQLAAREAIRQWRLGPALDQVSAAGEKFKRAGIRVLGFNYLLKDDCTDAEVERGFELTRAMGTDLMTVSTTLTMAKRTVPYAEKHKMYLGLHGHSNLSDPNQLATPESFAQGLAMSPNYRVNLDIGHFCAAGFDSVAYIRENHARITHLHVKDRKKNDGPNMPFGEGDTPIKAVLQLLKKEKYPIPAYIEYEYAGTGTSTQELRKCLDYVKAALV
jgi:sugar phosphate isomerase/epimerase